MTNTSSFKQTEIGEIPEHWNTSFLKELCVENGGVQTGPFGSQLHQRDYVAKGTPIITVEHLGENRIIHSDIPCISNEDRDRLYRYDLRTGDIVFSRVGSVDTRSLVRKEEEGWLFSGRCLRVRVNKDILNPIYLSYFFGHEGFKDYIRKRAVGATMPSLNTDILEKCTINYPSIPEQQQIASVLSSLDDKIELNRKMNKTLEDMAKALFKHWFVDFEFPDENGEPYQSSGGEMEESELGLIPKGWTVGCFADAIIVHDSKRKPLSSMEREKRKGVYPYYGATGILDYVDEYIFNDEYVLLGEDGSVAKDDGSPYTQYVWGQFWVSNHAHVLQGARGFSTEYVKVLLDLTDITAYITGAVQPKLNQENMNAIPIIIPSTSVLKIFNGILRSFFIQMATNSIQIETITHIRDSLLPKLMSGRIRV